MTPKLVVDNVLERTHHLGLLNASPSASPAELSKTCGMQTCQQPSIPTTVCFFGEQFAYTQNVIAFNFLAPLLGTQVSNDSSSALCPHTNLKVAFANTDIKLRAYKIEHVIVAASTKVLLKAAARRLVKSTLSSTCSSSPI